MKIKKQTGLRAFNDLYNYLDESTFAYSYEDIKNISDVNIIWSEDSNMNANLVGIFIQQIDSIATEEDLISIFDQQIDSIIVEDNLEIAKQFVKKYAKYDLKLVTHPSSGVGRFCTIFCCKSKILKEVFEKITKEREAFQKFLEEDGDVNNANFSWLVANYFDSAKNTKENSTWAKIIFQNDVCALFFTVEPFEIDSQKEVILSFSEKPQKYIYCEELLHDKISFYEFYWTIKELILESDSLEKFAFIFPNNPKEKEFYEKLVKQLKHNN